jgi:hypothetical protein
MFGQPNQHQHKLEGMRRAAASPRTPAHLRPHLQRQVEAQMKAASPKRVQSNNFTSPGAGKVPSGQVLRTTALMGASEDQPPREPDSFETPQTSLKPPTPPVQRSAPKPAGSRPMSVSPTLPARRGPGIVQSQGSVKNPSGPRSGARLGSVARPNDSRRGPGIQKRASLRGPSSGAGAGRPQAIAMQTTRNMRNTPRPNAAFYGEFNSGAR